MGGIGNSIHFKRHKPNKTLGWKPTSKRSFHSSIFVMKIYVVKRKIQGIFPYNNYIRRNKRKLHWVWIGNLICLVTLISMRIAFRLRSRMIIERFKLTKSCFSQLFLLHPHSTPQGRNNIKYLVNLNCKTNLLKRSWHSSQWCVSLDKDRLHALNLLKIKKPNKKLPSKYTPRGSYKMQKRDKWWWQRSRAWKSYKIHI